ncbi:flavin-containing monooxygenase 5-like [Ruditapes philippinarum]|uniref:flavin-containing monooxygenase 5-like n=1 Tax=Ruditapes philippinarum TaxID=129788 RepID=UPI00295BF0A4|nr:flavin-containing monooxygenase 5-like [Ruditapes philippinarum]
MKSVAVIGAGCCGLTAIKCCLDEGLEPVCFERGNYISGLWHYTEEVEEGQACVMKSTVINTSKEMMCYSDFPIPADFPIYMHHQQVDRYFHMYADKFGLRKYINFNTEVNVINNINHEGIFQVYLSTRSGSWIVNRVAEKGLPWDMVQSTCFNTKLLTTFPNMITSRTEKKLDQKIDHEKYCLKPKHGLFSARQTMNDELPNRIITGGVIVKANVAEFTETGAIFEDGTTIDNLDAVVLATGYNFGFEFIDKSVIEVKANKVNLYKYMFPPNLQKHTMAIIGCFQALGATMPLSEMQCRLATRVFKGLKTMPESSKMWKDIKSKQAAMGMRYKQSLRHTIQVDYVPYMDELAEMVGCKPNTGKLVLTDPKLSMEVFFGPCTPYQYRLMGPGPWKGARNAIMTQWERTYEPLQTRPCAKTERKSSGAFYMMIVAVIAVLLYFIL